MKTQWIGLALIGCLVGVSAPRVAGACGLVIPVEGETASVDAQRVTMAYFPEENRTRVMAQIGFVGDELSNFSWVIPLPTEPTNVSAIDEDGAQLFAELDSAGKPSFTVTDWTCALNDADGGGAPVSVPGVKVLQHGNTGTFEYVVLAGAGGSVVIDWLTEQGYSTPEGMAEVAHTYIREGAVFMAMKVNAEAAAAGQIDPAISFDYEGWPGYPLRILKPTTTEEVEIILDVLAPHGAEAPGEVRLRDHDLRWDELEPQYLEAVRDAGAWVLEHRDVLRERFVYEAGEWTELQPPRELIESVFGIPVDAPLVHSRFHAIFDSAQLEQDAALNVSEELTTVPPMEFSIDITRSDAECGWDDWEGADDDEAGMTDEDFEDDCSQGSCSGGGSPKSDSRAGCSTTTGNAHAVLLLFAVVVFGRRRRR